MKIEIGVPLPHSRYTTGKKRNWDEVPIGGSFEFADAKPQAVISSFASYMMRGKYRIKHIEGNRYRFWRIG